GGSQLGPVPPGTCSPRMRGCPHGQRYRTVLPAYAGIGEAPRVRTRGAFVCPQNERPRPQAAGCLPRRPCVISPKKRRPPPHAAEAKSVIRMETMILKRCSQETTDSTCKPCPT